MSRPLVDVSDLRIGFGRGSEQSDVVHGISFSIEEGETVAIVGESGSGKSVTARTLVGLTGDGSTVAADALRLGDHDLLSASKRAWRTIRGGEIGFVLQDALVSLDPLRTIGREIEEPLREHFSWTAERRGAEVLDLLRDVGVPEPELRRRQRPHELSGGLRQRALIASAIAARPPFLILDEATTALDVTVQAQILRLLGRFKDQGRTLLLITHDLAVVSQIADRVIVMKDGRVVETGTTDDVFTRAEHPYTRRLIAAIPSNRPRRAATVIERPASGDVGEALSPTAAVAQVSHISRTFALPTGGTLRALDDVSFDLHPGRTLGLVGESGSGKTTAGRILLGQERADDGDILVTGSRWSEVHGRERAALRQRIQAVYQDPLSSFDPRHSIDQVLTEAVRALGRHDRSARRARVRELLDHVELSTGLLERRPLQLSGGQRQRVAIARALALEPTIIVGDEPVSALDVSIQAQILDLLVRIQKETHVALLLISHDFGVVNAISDEVLVLKDGRTVEHDTVSNVFDRPQAEYTRELLAAIPRFHGTSSTISPTIESLA
ncbi:ABC transporter ATP-binding protein [Microbacterium sp.]|uniref:ABC transporter ATP-binding protein n=1 Tax=Microbacterium sp. TaxID=51671 RepID=UPI0028A1DE06|nr:ABC transporter ATP-binding protein [Microbacterium sp.]